MNTNLPTGKNGEDIACTYLKKQGYKILERNFRTRNGEIDIIALDNNTLVFIEVKTRSTFQFGTPSESITSWKLKALQRTAVFYSSIHTSLPSQLRLDLISIMLNTEGKPASVEVIKNIG